ncbi:retrovirus-related Pol polyprotein from transposon opus [Trichonephila clavipes]|nr:retrovirus-related Pol polyprotein from transposon opus [Trichonephila clavipes]
MPLCLSGADPNFQKAINIRRLVLGKYVSVYMYDAIISSPSFAQHVEHSREVFRLLQEAGLTLNKDKRDFGCENLKYLGLVISKDGITTVESKVKAIIEMKPPKNSREVSKFLGMTQWYQKLIKNYAGLCESLYQIKRKFKKFGRRRRKVVFESIKQAIMEAPVLKLPDFNMPFELFTDASSIGIGAVLIQEQRPIAYASRTLNNTERNYTVSERECLVVIWALNKFRTNFGLLPVKVITDHMALTKLTHGKNLSS